MRAAMRYPAITVGVILIAIAILTTFVLPQFAPIFKVLGDNIPLPTRIIMGFSTYTREYWPFILCATTFVVFIVRQYVRTTAGRYLWHKTKLKLPIVGKLTHEAILSRISRSLAISLNAGMPMLQTLSIIAKTAGNDYMTERVVKLRDAIERGARVLVGGKRLAELGPNYYAPTVLADATADMQLTCEETFGPVAALFRFDTEDEAVDAANDTPFGLAAYFYTQDVRRIARVSARLETGIVGINEGALASEAAPFGGVKESGYGREGSRYGLDDYLSIKYLCQGGLD